MHDAEFITLKEAADDVRLSVSTLKRYIYSGQLRSYRTPGGRHRVRRADLAALLGAPPSVTPAETAALAPLDALAEDVAGCVDRALRRRLARVESDVERLECSLDAIAAVIRRAVAQPQQPASAQQLPSPLEIKVLGPGCRACDQLADLVTEIARAVGLSDQSISRVREIDEIAEYGPTPMPALVVNDQLLAAGRLPTKSRLTELLQRYRPNEPHAETH
jgi:excisionase family DNA binding protein